MGPSLDSSSVPIVNIRRIETEDSLVQDIYSGLDVEDGKPRTLPTLLLYNAEGLRLFEEITYIKEYYLTNAEIEVLTTLPMRARLSDGFLKMRNWWSWVAGVFPLPRLSDRD